MAEQTPFESAAPAPFDLITRVAIKVYEATRSGKAIGFELHETRSLAGFLSSAEATSRAPTHPVRFQPKS